jgi:CelD/BcsL family acetyltransferase involved in cellulose biosynthesis
MGFEQYVAEKRAAGSDQFKKDANLRRRIEREHGPLVFQERVVDTAALEQLFEWKSAPCRSSGSVDVFAVAWTKQLLRNLMHADSQCFAGMLSLLRVGDRVVAAHMGMRSARAWHYWFPSYDEAFSKYSPGVMLLLSMAASAESIGIRAIDLGKGDSFYKDRLSNATVSLVEGRVSVPSIFAGVRSLRRRTEAWVDSGAVQRVVGFPIRALRRIERQRKFH